VAAANKAFGLLDKLSQKATFHLVQPKLQPSTALALMEHLPAVSFHLSAHPALSLTACRVQSRVNLILQLGAQLVVADPSNVLQAVQRRLPWTLKVDSLVQAAALLQQVRLCPVSSVSSSL